LTTHFRRALDHFLDSERGIFLLQYHYMKLVIGLVGAPLAGKETCANILERLLIEDGYSVSRHAFSEILRETLDLWDIPHGRDNEQRMAIVMNAETGFGGGALSQAMRRRLMEDTADVTILDGVRWLGDEHMIRSLADVGIKTIMVYIAADAKVRYARLLARNRVGEAATTWEKFMQQEQMKNEVNIPDIGSRAEIVLENNHDNVEHFERDINRVYENLFDETRR
jgi:pantothenate kinase